MSNCFRKEIRRILCFVCIISLCLQFPVPVTAEAGTIWSHAVFEGLSFREIAGNGWMVCDYNPENNTDTSLYIPNSYKVTDPSNNEEVIYTVRGIEDSVFGTKGNGSNYTFSKVAMQASDDTAIGRAAFRGVQVETTFTVQSGGKLKKIGESAFQNAEIGGSMVINSLEECSIGSHAFRNMKINEKIQLYGSIDTLGDYAFSHLTCNGLILPDTIRNMGDGVFYNTKMTGATYPLSDALESIGSRVFEETGLKAIQLSEGNNLQSVAEDAFEGIEGTTIIMPPTVEGNNIINLINLYHINANQKLIIRIPSDLPAGSELEIYLKQNGFQYQKGDEGEIVIPTPSATPTVSPTKTPEPTPATESTLRPVNTPEPVDNPTDTPEPTDKPTGTPEPTDKPTSTPEPTDKPTGTPESTDNPIGTPEPTDKPADTPEPTAKSTDMPSSTGTAGPINTLSAAPSAEPVPASDATKKPNPTPTAPQPSSDTKPTAKPGMKVFQVKKLKYELAGKNQVTVIGAVHKNETSITIPNTVTIQGRLYRVTRIKAKAFRNLKSLKTVKVGNYVKVVEAEAFARCQGLSKIQFGTGLVSLGKKSLYLDKRLRIIVFKGTKLKKIGKKTFFGISPKKVSIRVKKSKMKAYLGLIRKAKSNTP